MQLAQGKNQTCFICVGIGNLSNFAVVKSLRKFGGCPFFLYIYDFQYTKKNLHSPVNLKTYVPASKQKKKKEN